MWNGKPCLLHIFRDVCNSHFTNNLKKKTSGRLNDLAKVRVREELELWSLIL